MPICGVSWRRTPGPPCLCRCSCRCAHVETRTQRASLLTEWTLAQRQLLQSRLGRDSASLFCSCTVLWHLSILFYCTLNVKLECKSAAGLCLEELHAIDDRYSRQTFGIWKHTKKDCDFLFSIWAFDRRKHGKNILSPCLIGLHSVTPPELRFF